MMRSIKGLVYKPFNLLYMAFLFFVLFTVASWFLSFFRGLLVETLGIPQEYFWAVALLSLIGSYVNLPLAVLESEKLVIYKEEVTPKASPGWSPRSTRVRGRRSS